MVPGGPGTADVLDGALVEWLRRVHPTTRWTTSVCSGSLVLAAAGLLGDGKATSHFAVADLLPMWGVAPTSERVVVDAERRIITAAGVSSGIDMALTLTELLTDTITAQAIQLVIEYDPEPPHSTGVPDRCEPGGRAPGHRGRPTARRHPRALAAAGGVCPTVTVSRLLKGPAPVLVLVAAAAVAAGLRGDFTDLFVYQHGGRGVLDGLEVYESRDPVTGLPFTYPPFAAVVMVPLALLPAWLAAALLDRRVGGALAAVVVVVRRALDRPAPGWLVALVTAGALALEPVWQNLTFGQVNVFLMLAVLVDLVRPERRWSGVLVGIAAGVKLTPLVFVVLLVLVGRRSAAGRAVLAFAGTVAIGFVVTPGSAATYWADGLVDAGRVGPPALAHNQSVYGALTRLLDGPPPTLLWLAVAGTARRSRCWSSAPAGGGAATGCSAPAWGRWPCCSPRRSRGRTTGCGRCRSRWCCGSAAGGRPSAWTAVFVARPVLWPPYGRGREYGWSPLEHLVGNAYLLAALAFSVWAAATLEPAGGSPGPFPTSGARSILRPWPTPPRRRAWPSRWRRSLPARSSRCSSGCSGRCTTRPSTARPPSASAPSST